MPPRDPHRLILPQRPRRPWRNPWGAGEGTVTLATRVGAWLAPLVWAIDRRRAPNFASAPEAGRYGEAVAARFLRRHGYLILEMNFRIPEGELDIIAEDRDGLAFVEVKALRTDKWLSPYERVNREKQRRLAKAAEAWLRGRNLRKVRFRGDIVEVILKSGDVPQCRLLKDAHRFDEYFRWW
ncbi:hypothetical protein DB346_07000 [Verrucomicrobia bacterium LW23]|nr:hypothetical protein DB346_07000 [Verrucomicrobia bacterium LW23]